MSNMKSPLPQCASMVRIQKYFKWKVENNYFVVYFRI